MCITIKLQKLKDKEKILKPEEKNNLQRKKDKNYIQLLRNHKSKKRVREKKY